MTIAIVTQTMMANMELMRGFLEVMVQDEDAEVDVERECKICARVGDLSDLQLTSLSK
jgi:hypothetical protein